MKHHTRLIGVVAFACMSVAHAQDWTHFAQGPNRVAVRTGSIGTGQTIGSALWTVSTGPAGEAVSFLGRTSVVQSDDHIVGIGRVDGLFAVIDVDANDGEVRWFAPIATPFADSWASPAIDATNHTVLVASDDEVAAFDLSSGASLWQASLQRRVVNASPLVTTHLGPADRAFVTDFAFGGQTGRLYCINVDAFDAALNPHDPGDIVWSVGVGEMSGASPTLAGENVVVATSDGRVVAFPVDAAAPPEPVWDSPNPGGLGLFSGVAYRGGALYVASYNFFGGQTSSNLIKLDALTGQVLWSVPSNRTDAVPLPLVDGRIILSTGVNGFGSRASVQMFQDNLTSASLMWDTFLDGGPEVGYWTHTPVALESLGGAFVMASAPPPGDPYGASPATLVLNLSKLPNEAGFVQETLNGVGISAIGPAARVYGIGAGGLRAYQLPPAPCPADFNDSGIVDFFDLISYLEAFTSNDPEADLTGDGLINFFDLQAFLTIFGMGCTNP